MHKWLAKSHFTIFSTSLPQRRGLTIFCREPSTKKGSCWLPDACGFHVAGVTGGSRGRKCGTPRHCISRIIHFFSYSHSPAAPRLNSRILINCLLSSLSALGPCLNTKSLYLPCSRKHTHVLISPNFLWNSPKSIDLLPTKAFLVLFEELK